MNNKLSDLNNHLFAALERLNDEELLGERLQEEVIRTEAIIGVAGQIVSNASLALKAQTVLYDSVGREFNMPKMLEG